MNRRRFLGWAAASSAWMAGHSLLATGTTSKPHPIGIILNTVKREMQSDWKGTLRALREMGYQHLEGGFSGSSAGKYKRFANRIGLETICGGSSIQDLLDNYDKWLGEADALDYRYIICYYPWLVGSDKINVEESYQTADRLNDLGRRMKTSGVSFAWHPHAWEYRKESDGQTPLSVIMENTDPGWVSLEMDIYWTVKGGADPLRCLQQFPGRTQLLHVKDMADEPEGPIACVGDGIIDYEALLKQAAADEIPYWFVENETDESDIACARSSAHHLKSII